jgi:hypothetical protein
MAISASARKPEATQVYVAMTSAEVHHDAHDICITVDQTFVMGDDPLLAQVPHLFARVYATGGEGGARSWHSLAATSPWAPRRRSSSRRRAAADSRALPRRHRLPGRVQ